MVVIVFVCLSVILQCDFLCNHNKLSNKSAMQLKLCILTPLNWLDFTLRFCCLVLGGFSVVKCLQYGVLHPCSELYTVQRYSCFSK